MIKIPILTVNDVEARVQSFAKNGRAKLLIYKDARVDMRILDEVFGVFGWQRHHELIDGKLFCTVSVKNPETGEWVHKQDVGTESNTEAEKGQASDAFKRACFNLGIGRELYNTPEIWVDAKKEDYPRFTVSELEYDSERQEYTKLTILDKKGNIAYKLNHTIARIVKDVDSVEEETVSKPISKVDIGYTRDGKQYCKLANSKGEWVDVKDMPVEQLRYCIRQECYQDAFTIIADEIDRKGATNA